MNEIRALLKRGTRSCFLSLLCGHLALELPASRAVRNVSSLPPSLWHLVQQLEQTKIRSQGWLPKTDAKADTGRMSSNEERRKRTSRQRTSISKTQRYENVIHLGNCRQFNKAGGRLGTLWENRQRPDCYIQEQCQTPANPSNFTTVPCFSILSMCPPYNLVKLLKIEIY